MKFLRDGFQVRKITPANIDAVAPVYLLGLPGDLDNLESYISDLEEAVIETEGVNING